MIHRLFLLLLLCCGLARPVCSVKASPGSTSVDKPALAEGLEGLTNLIHIRPGPADGRIAFVTARMLEKFQYLKQPFDAALSSKVFDRYLDTLDPQHLHFLQTDLEDFAYYRTNLDRMTVGISRHGVADTAPADEIFNRFYERLVQRAAYAEETLKHEAFKFDGNEKLSITRHGAPFPKDLSEAQKLWHERLRFEYLQERLAKIDAKKKADAAAKAELHPQPAKESGRNSTPAAADAKVAAAPKTEAEEVVDTLMRRYHRNLRTFADWNNEDVLQVYLSALAHVYDPHSDYLGPAQLDSFAISMNLSLFGIGAELVSDDGYCTFRRLLPGPAMKSKKIKEGDRIVAVAQSNQPPVDVVDMRLDKAVQLIRGPKGTEVRLTLIPDGADLSVRKVVSLIRDEISLEEQAAKARIIEFPKGRGGSLRLGVIDVPSFYGSFETASAQGKSGPKSTTADVARLLSKLKKEGVEGVILDLRRNGGGSLEEAIKLTGLFIKQGPILQVRDADGLVQQDLDTDPSSSYDGPLVVLTSRFSASASEILAGALQDYGRALVVGDSSTHGKGTVQSVTQLRPLMRLPDSLSTNDPGALKLTIKKFYRASGASTQLKGVVPDIVLPSVLNEVKDIGESSLENPLPWDTIPSAAYEPLNLVAPYLPELCKRSSQRVAVDPEFGYVREDIEQYRKQQADKTVSLNEKQRLKERDEAEARQKARDKERLARHEPPEKIYELTLSQVDLPGLPAPVQRTNSAVARLSIRPGVEIAAVSTNSVAATPKSAFHEGNADDNAEEEKPPAEDIMLVETEHILADYLSILPSGGLLTAKH